MAENKQHKRKERRSSGGARGLEEKVNVMMGGQSGLALEIDPKTPIDSNSRRMTHGGIYGQRRRAVPSNSHARIFPTPRSSHSYLQKDTPARSVAMSTNSRLSRFSRASTANPSGNRNRMQNSTAAVHIVCAISENLAQETCVASVDAGSPISVHVTKQGNGQTYAETMAYLEVLKPDEVLLNEGRRNSQLARKIMDLFNVNSDPVVEPPLERSRHRHRDDYVYNIHEQNDPPEVSTVVKFISRAYFDQTRGAELLRKIVREDSYDATLVEEYILLSSSHAVLHYVQHCLGANFLNNSVHLSINSGGNNRMEIDRSTMLQLELLMNSKTGKVKDSLIGMMDSTKTTVGSRLLRTNLMSPPTRTDTINTRLELVDLILSNADFFYSILEHLSDLPDVDKMLSNVALVPRIHTTEKGPMSTKSQDRIASRGISALVCIKTALQSLPSFATSLGNHLLSLDECDQDGAATFNDDTTIATDRSTLLIGLGGATRGFLSNDTRHHRLLRAIIFALTQPRLSTVLESVTGIFTESTTFSRNANVMRHQVCFAFKSEEKSIMSVIRKAYLAHVDNIYRKADEYAEVHGFSVTVRYSKSRGYYLAVPLDAGTTLPQVFSQPSKSGRYITCTTLEIASLNARAQDNVHDLLKMTQGRIEEVMNVARANYDAIATVCDAIAILDMCHSFADNVLTQTTMKWCRPDVTEPTDDSTENMEASLLSNQSDKLMIIRNGRCPLNVFESTGFVSDGGPTEFIPNDTYASYEKFFTVVTGINGSGKSTYLKQIAIITIMAHCGSYVTADSAKIPIRDRVCCRIGNADDQEHNISTFMLEMRETAFICNNATSRSLILVDELGRATSNEDGVAIAWSVSEYLLKKQVMTFFVTHYPQLSTLAHIYPSVQNIHLEASVSRGNGGEVRYTHKAKLGACKVSTDYGVELAASCGWPEDIVNVARSTQEQVKALLPDEGLCSLDDVSNVRTKAYEELVNVCHHLQSLITDEQVHSYSSIKASLHRLQIRRNSNADSENFRAAMDHLLGREVHTNREIVSSDDFLFNQRQHNDTRTYTEESLEGEVADTFNSPSIWDDGMNRVSASVDMNDGTRSSGSGRKDDDDDGNSSTSLESDDESVSTDSSQSASE